MSAAQVFTYVPYSGYPRVLPTACGRPMAVVVDATAPTAFRRLWGMTLLERNLRLVERLGAAALHVLVRPEDVRRAGRRRFPVTVPAEIHATDSDPREAAQALLGRLGGPALLLAGHGLYDRRVVAALWQHPAPAAAVAAGRPLEALALLWGEGAPPLAGAEWQEVTARWLQQPQVSRVELGEIEARVSLLRKTVPPQVIRVDGDLDRRRADAYLRELAGKGVNDIVGEFVHPPIEFALTRMAANTPVTPNQISYLIVVLSLAGLYYFATGQLWAAIAVNLVRGVVDGVDGKLARLTLRETEKGNLLDHGTDTAYLPLIFLCLGWHFAGGDPRAPAAVATYVLQGCYWLNCVLASWFRYYLGVDESEFRPVDRFVRRFQPKRNIIILILIVAMLVHRPLGGFYAVVAMTGLYTIYRLVRLDQEGRRLYGERARAGVQAAASGSAEDRRSPQGPANPAPRR